MTVALRPVEEIAEDAKAKVEDVTRRVRTWWPRARVEHIGAPLGRDGYWAAKDAFLSRVVLDFYPLPKEDVPTLTTARLVLRQTRAGDVATIRRFTAQQDEGTLLPWALMLDDGTFIGRAGLHHIDGTKAQVGYELERAHWGQGFMTEALGAILAFSRGRFERIEAWMDPGNVRSERVATRCGFSLESRTSEDVVYVHRAGA